MFEYLSSSLTKGFRKKVNLFLLMAFKNLSKLLFCFVFVWLFCDSGNFEAAPNS